jgi:hypothetical protein
MKARKLALRVLLASVAISALLGIIAVLGGGMGYWRLQVFLTTLTISGSSLLAMAAFSAWHTDGARLFSRVGLISSIAFAVLGIAGIWIGPSSETMAKLTLTFLIFGTAGAHGSLVSLARLAPQHQWARPTAHAIGTLLVAAVLAVLWEVTDGDTMWRVIGVLSILDGASTVVIVAFHVMDRVAPPTGTVAEVCFCPRCGKRLWVPAGEVRCHHCTERFFIELRPKSDPPDAIIL